MLRRWLRASYGLSIVAKHHPSSHGPRRNHPDLDPCSSGEDQHGRRKQCDKEARNIRAQLAPHAPYGLGDNRNCRELEPMDPAGMLHRAKGRESVPERDHDRGRRQQKADGCGQPSPQPSPSAPQAKYHLCAGRTGQKLAERDEVGVIGIADPAPALHELGVEISKMGNRAAERGQAQFEKGAGQLGDTWSNGRACFHA